MLSVAACLASKANLRRSTSTPMNAVDSCARHPGLPMRLLDNPEHIAPLRADASLPSATTLVRLEALITHYKRRGTITLHSTLCTLFVMRPLRSLRSLHKSFGQGLPAAAALIFPENG